MAERYLELSFGQDFFSEQLNNQFGYLKKTEDVENSV